MNLIVVAARPLKLPSTIVSHRHHINIQYTVRHLYRPHRHLSSPCAVARLPSSATLNRCSLTDIRLLLKLRCRSPAVVSHTRSLFTHRHLSSCAVARLPSSATLNRCSLTDICLPLVLSLACRRQPHSIVVHSQTFVFPLRCRSPAVVSHTRSLFAHRHSSSSCAVARLPSSATLDRCSLTDICLLALSLACRRQPHSIIVRSQTFVFFSLSLACRRQPHSIVVHSQTFVFLRCRSPAVVSHTRSLFTHRHLSSPCAVARLPSSATLDRCSLTDICLLLALSLACRRQLHSIVVHSQTFVFSLRCRSPAVVSHTRSLFTHRHLSSPCAVARLPSSATLDRCSLTDICLPLALSLACRRQPHSIIVRSQTFVFFLRCRSPAVVSHTRSLFAHRHSSSSCAVARLPSSATLDRCSLTDICLLALSLACRRQPHSIIVRSQTFVFFSLSLACRRQPHSIVVHSQTFVFLRCRSPAVVSHTRSLFTHRHLSSPCAVARLPSSATLDRCSLTDICLLLALSLACRHQLHSIVVHSQTFVFSLRCRSPAVVSHTRSLFTHRHLSSPRAVARLPSSATLDRCSLTDICLLLALSLACRRQLHSIVVHSQTFVFSLRCRSPAVVSHTRSLFTHRHLSSPCAVARLPSSATLDRCSLTDICLPLALSLACRRQPHSIIVRSQTFVFFLRCRSPAVVSHTRSLFTHRHLSSCAVARLPSSATLDHCSLTDIRLLLALSLACRRQPHSIVVHSQTFVFLRCRSPAVVSHTRSLFAHRHSSSSCAVARLPSSATLDRCSLTDICLLALSLACRRQPHSIIVRSQTFVFFSLSLACRRQPHSIVVHSQTFVFLRCRSPAVVSHTRSLFTHRHLSSPCAVARLPSSATLDRCSLTDICLLLALSLACRHQLHSIVVHSQTFVFSLRCRSPAVVSHTRSLFTHRHLSSPRAVARLPSSATLDRCSLTDICLLLALSLACRRQLHSIVVHSQTFVFSLRCRSPAVVSRTRLFTHRRLSSLALSLACCHQPHLLLTLNTCFALNYYPPAFSHSCHQSCY